MHNERISIYAAIKRMRELTNAGVSFSFSFYKADGSVKQIHRAVLRKGYRSDQSKKATIVIGYTDLDGDKHRQFHRSCLISFNNYKVGR